MRMSRLAGLLRSIAGLGGMWYFKGELSGGSSTWCLQITVVEPIRQ